MTMTVNVGHLWRNCCGVPTTDPSPACRRIDRSMIGLPTDFRHIGHIGSTEVAVTGNGNPPAPQSLTAVQEQMRSKGGYEQALPVNCVLKVRDLKPR